MVDFVDIEAPFSYEIPSGLYEPFYWKELCFTPKFKKGFLKGFESEFKGLKVTLYEDKIRITNSLHKFYKGNNYSDFTFSELTDSINIITKYFETEASQFAIRKLEYGFNITTLQPAKEYLNLFAEYHNREFEKMKHKHIFYGRKCVMSEYTLKVYDKSQQVKIMNNVLIPANTLRVEFCYNQKRKLPQTIRTLSDLTDNNKIKELFKDFKSSFSKVIFNEGVDLGSMSNDDRILFYASLHSDFIKVEEKLDKSNVKTIKSKIRQLKEKYLSKEFKNIFINLLNNKYIELYCS
ncbi:hypothetical protein [Capnocytophaga cynodegmi]|uniref:hypothetical protein n=1 Tax=Capnocytophaga cynodegmi TaxID=28189 RepID=UPI00385C9F85